MASLVLSGDTSGSITVSAPAVAGSNTQTLVATTGTLAPVVSGTAVTVSGTSVEFTGIPSWVKRVTVIFSGVSTNGTSDYQVQVGSGSVTTSGYASGSARVAAGNSTGRSTSIVGFVISTNSISSTISGVMTIVALGNNVYVSSHVANNDGSTVCINGGGTMSALSGPLDRIRIIGSATGSPSDTFDAGTINILYE